jgi:hypothetical protein
MFSCPVAVFPELKRELNRYRSFFINPLRSSFAETGFENPKQLAAAGFYYYYQKGYVQCAFCGVEVGHWQPGENPARVHKDCSPGCRFINGDYVGNIPFDHFEQCELFEE